MSVSCEMANKVNVSLGHVFPVLQYSTFHFLKYFKLEAQDKFKVYNIALHTERLLSWQRTHLLYILRAFWEVCMKIDLKDPEIAVYKW